MALVLYLQLRKTINACGNIISISLKAEVCFVLSEICIQADCEELEKESSGRVHTEDKVSQINGRALSNGNCSVLPGQRSKPSGLTKKSERRRPGL